MNNIPAPVDLLQFLPNRDLLDLSTAPHLWNVNAIRPGADSTTIEGWSLPHGGRTANTALKINGQVYPVGGAGAPAGNYAELYPWWPNAAHSGFTLQVPHSQLDVPKVGELSIESVPADGSASAPGYTLDMLISDLNFEIPSKEIAARIGVGDPFHYTLFGRSIYCGFERTLSRSLGTSFSKAGQILDWGCGSGRVSRHVVGRLLPGQILKGFDIDAPAVVWSNENVGLHFAVSKLDPPLDVQSGSIDIAFAYSVFTHLSEDAFFNWISEMARVIRPGGALLFTVLGDFAMAALAPGFPRVAHERWRERGIYDDSGNAQLETIGVTGATYRNTWVKRTFVEKALGSDFELVNYVRPFHFYQDLVVARRR